MCHVRNNYTQLKLSQQDALACLNSSANPKLNDFEEMCLQDF